MLSNLSKWANQKGGQSLLWNGSRFTLNRKMGNPRTRSTRGAAKDLSQQESQSWPECPDVFFSPSHSSHRTKKIKNRCLPRETSTQAQMKGKAIRQFIFLHLQLQSLSTVILALLLIEVRDQSCLGRPNMRRTCSVNLPNP